MRHTPLPWSPGGQLINGAPEPFPNPKAQPMGKTVLSLCWNYDFDHGMTERRIDGNEMMANRDFILRAVNCHYELLAACQALQMEAASRGCGLKIADEAIAKATGKAVQG